MTIATFNNPTGIAVDSQSNIYVVDAYNHAVRYLDATSNLLLTMAGNGILGSTDGVGSLATFAFSVGIAVSADGSLIFIADQTNGLIRKVECVNGNTISFGKCTTAPNPTLHPVTASPTLKPATASPTFNPTTTSTTSPTLSLSSQTYLPNIQIVTFAGSTFGSTDGTGSVFISLIIFAAFNFFIRISNKLMLQAFVLVWITSHSLLFFNLINIDPTNTWLGVIENPGGRVRKIDIASVTSSTIASSLTYPQTCSIDNAGNLYISEASSLKKISGLAVSIVYSGFTSLVGVAVRVDGTILYLGDSGSLFTLNVATSTLTNALALHLIGINLHANQLAIYAGSYSGDVVYKIDVTTWTYISYGQFL